MKGSQQGCRSECPGGADGTERPDVASTLDANQEAIVENVGLKPSILFVDDEVEIAEMEKQILENFGYRVMAITNGMEALKLFSSTPDAFDLVITDYVMPDRTGLDLARELLSIRSDIPVIICTGYSEHTIAENAGKLGIRSLLLKPYSTREILEAIGMVLKECR